MELQVLIVTPLRQDKYFNKLRQEPSTLKVSECVRRHPSFILTGIVLAKKVLHPMQWKPLA